MRSHRKPNPFLPSLQPVSRIQQHLSQAALDLTDLDQRLCALTNSIELKPDEELSAELRSASTPYDRISSRMPSSR